MSHSNSKSLVLYNIILAIILSLFFLGLDRVNIEGDSMTVNNLIVPYSQEKVQLQISKPHFENQIGYSQSNTNNHYVIISARVTNAGKEIHHANPLLFTLIDNNGRSYSIDYASFDIAILGKEFPTVDLQPSTNAEGILVFQTPKDVKPNRVVYSPMLGNEISVEIMQGTY